VASVELELEARSFSPSASGVLCSQERTGRRLIRPVSAGGYDALSSPVPGLGLALIQRMKGPGRSA
jgi:hypothetical protein